MTAPIDPFGAAPAAPAPEEAQQTTPPSDPWQPVTTIPAPTVVQGSDGKVVLTFKGGTGFEQPWVVIHANSLEEAQVFVGEKGPVLLDLFQRVQVAAALFRGGATGAAGVNTAPSQPAPAVATAGPKNKPAQPGPGWVHREGVKNGRAWAGWLPPMDQKDSVKAQFYDPEY